MQGRAQGVLLVSLVCAFLGSAVQAGAVTWLVPSAECPTVQSGLDHASTGDTVRVGAGRYHEDIFWPFENGIVLRGAGFDSTSVIGGGVESVLYIANAVPIDTTTVLEGIRFCNGGDAGVVLYGVSPVLRSCAIDSTTHGSGVYCVAGSGARILDCRIRFNAGDGLVMDGCDSRFTVSGCLLAENGPGVNMSWAGLSCLNGSAGIVTGCTIRGTVGGPGIDVRDASPTIVENTILENTGGIRLTSSSAVILGNIVTGNNGSGWGCGIFVMSGSPTITGNEISGNSGSAGGGLYLAYSSATVADNLIYGNRATVGGGGGIATSQSADAITGNRILDNSAVMEGGGIYSGNSTLTIRGNLIARNRSARGGGIGILMAYGSPTVRENRIVENEASGDGGAVFSQSGSLVQFSANTMADNSCQGSGGAYCLSGGIPALSHDTIVRNHAGGLGDGIWTYGTTPVINGCNIEDNGWGAYNASFQYIPDFRDNWWGDPTGPWHQANPAGLGDSLSTYGWEFVPWLETPDPTAPPPPPRNLVVLETGPTHLRLAWDSTPLADLSGYRVYFDSDSTGFPYSHVVEAGPGNEFDLQDLLPGTRYYLAVTCLDAGGEESWYSREQCVETSGTADVPAAETGDVATGLLGSYPNPFDQTTSVVYRVRSDAHVLLEVFDTSGRRVKRLLDGSRPAGSGSVTWDGLDETGQRVSKGIYLVRCEAEGRSQTRKALYFP